MIHSDEWDRTFKLLAEQVGKDDTAIPWTDTYCCFPFRDRVTGEPGRCRGTLRVMLYGHGFCAWHATRVREMLAKESNNEPVAGA